MCLSTQHSKGKTFSVQALQVPEGRGSQISRQTPQEVGEVVSPTHRRAFAPQEIFLVLISVRGGVVPRVIVRPKWLCLSKIQRHHQESNPRPSGFRFSFGTRDLPCAAADKNFTMDWGLVICVAMQWATSTDPSTREARSTFLPQTHQ